MSRRPNVVTHVAPRSSGASVGGLVAVACYAGLGASRSADALYCPFATGVLPGIVLAPSVAALPYGRVISAPGLTSHIMHLAYYPPRHFVPLSDECRVASRVAV